MQLFLLDNTMQTLKICNFTARQHYLTKEKVDFFIEKKELSLFVLFFLQFITLHGIQSKENKLFFYEVRY